MSIRNQWRLVIALLTSIAIGGVMLVALLASGLADPPHAGELAWSMAAPAGWPQQSLTAELTVAQAPDDLTFGFTLELTAQNSGPAESAWGIQLMHTERPMTILIDNQGYYSIFPNQPQWVQFPHIRPGQVNKLYLHVEENGATTLRINDEIVHEDIAFFAPVGPWGVAYYRQPQLAWEGIALYHQP